ncbi:MAG: phosphate signaling complex protein PhoU [Phycisphaerae bacterium]
MRELQQRLEKVILRLDTMGMRVEQAVVDAIRAIDEVDADFGRQVSRRDEIIDKEEVEIEQDCIRLLALYQPAAIDLRTVCTIIKVNSDLERIADLAAGMGRRVKHMVECEIDLSEYPRFSQLVQATVDNVGRTVRMLSVPDSGIARRVIELDVQIDRAYKDVVRNVLDNESQRVGGAESAITVINFARALERIGDLCTNIAEDIIFLRTGDIVRHQQLPSPEEAQ